MSESNISKMDLPIRTYEFSHLGNASTLTFDQRYLYVNSKVGVTHRTSTHLLHQLSPKIVEDCSNEPEAWNKARVSWAFLLAAVVVFFSDYNVAIPLLAPALALLWLTFFASNIRRAWPYDWLVVGDQFGRCVARVRALGPKDASDKTRQDAFVSSLSRAIDEAVQKEYFPRAGA